MERPVRMGSTRCQSGTLRFNFVKIISSFLISINFFLPSNFSMLWPFRSLVLKQRAKFQLRLVVKYHRSKRIRLGSIPCFSFLTTDHFYMSKLPVLSDRLLSEGKPVSLENTSKRGAVFFCRVCWPSLHPYHSCSIRRRNLTW
jgi:hypothetical protein